MTSTHAQAAKLIRQELKKNGISATVRAKTYAGGDSIRVSLTDELPATRAAVEAFAKDFQEGHFNGMEDIYEYSNTNDNLPQVKFVFIDNDFSDEIKNAAFEYAQGYFQAFEDIEGNYADHMNTSVEGDYVMTWIYQILTGVRGSFWTARKPRVAA